MSGKAVVVGGGIVGLCSAFYLSEWGWDVTVLERGKVADAGASHGNAGLIVPSHFVPLASPGTLRLGMRLMWNPAGPLGIRPSAEMARWSLMFRRAATAGHVERVSPLIRDLNLESRRLYKVLANDLGWQDMPKITGLTVVASKEQTVHELHHLVDQAVSFGLEAQKLDDLLLRHRLGPVEANSPGGAWFGCDGHLDPGVVMARLAGFLRARGIRFFEDCEVETIHHNGHRISRVEAGGLSFDADEFVFAAGVWTGRLAEQLRIDLPLVPGKGQHMDLAKPPVKLEGPILLEDARVAVTPLSDGSVRFAGTMELGAWSSKVNPRRLAGMRRSIGGVLPQFRGKLEQASTWSGLRPCLPDGLPAVGRAGGFSNLFVATGHAMMGMSLGPVTGLAVAETLSGAKPTVPIHALSPERFAR